MYGYDQASAQNVPRSGSTDEAISAQIYEGLAFEEMKDLVKASIWISNVQLVRLSSIRAKDSKPGYKVELTFAHLRDESLPKLLKDKHITESYVKFAEYKSFLSKPLHQNYDNILQVEI